MNTPNLSVLEVIVRNNDSELVHPILTSLIDKKWKHFVHRVLVRRFLLTFLYLMTFLLTTILEQSRPETVTVRDRYSALTYHSSQQRKTAK
jgi:hypothetical protein